MQISARVLISLFTPVSKKDLFLWIFAIISLVADVFFYTDFFWISNGLFLTFEFCEYQLERWSSCLAWFASAVLHNHCSHTSHPASKNWAIFENVRKKWKCFFVCFRSPSSAWPISTRLGWKCQQIHFIFSLFFNSFLISD